MKYDNDILNQMANVDLNSIDPILYPEFISFMKKGSKIYIKPQNRGKFTASAKRAGEGVQEHAYKVINDPNATTLQKKRAQFAINSKKWHKK